MDWFIWGQKPNWPAQANKTRTLTDYSSRIGTDCTAKRNIGKLLANSIIYRYLCSEELLVDVLGGKDALRAFKESDEKGYLEVEVLSFFLLFFP